MALLETQKTYLSNINQQLLKPEYQNNILKSIKAEVSDLIVTLEVQLALIEHDLKMGVVRLLISVELYYL